MALIEVIANDRLGQKGELSSPQQDWSETDPILCFQFE